MNNTTRLPFRALVSACLSSILLVSCASQGSNARALEDEKFEASIHEKRKKPKISLLTGEVLLYGALQSVLEKLVDHEAEKYTQESKLSLSLENKELPVFRGSSEDKFVVITRSYPYLKRYGKAGQSFPKEGHKYRSLVIDAVEDQGIEKRSLSFAAILKISSASGNGPFKVSLVGYYYPLLKAKNFPVSVPFSNIENTDSALLTSFEGLQGSGTYGAAGYSVSGAVSLKWKKGKRNPDWVFPKKETVLYRANKTSESSVVFKAKLIESSDLTKKMKDLKDEIDVKGWLDKDEKKLE